MALPLHLSDNEACPRHSTLIVCETTAPGRQYVGAHFCPKIIHPEIVSEVRFRRRSERARKFRSAGL